MVATPLRKSIHPSFVTLWRGFLRDVLAWPEEEILAFASEWEEFLNSGSVEEDLFYHDTAAAYVAGAAVPKPMRHLNVGAELEKRILAMIEVRTNFGQTLEIDWKQLRRDIEALLRDYGGTLPLPPSARS